MQVDKDSNKTKISDLEKQKGLFADFSFLYAIGQRPSKRSNLKEVSLISDSKTIIFDSEGL